jgi:uncharacterized protein (DUF433 family)
MNAIINRNPNIMHGAACFAGTRVTIDTLFDHLKAGYSIEAFLSEFPTVQREQVVGLLEQLRNAAERETVVETA